MHAVVADSCISAKIGIFATAACGERSFSDWALTSSDVMSVSNVVVAVIIIIRLIDVAV